jgi:hypothetical protein
MAMTKEMNILKAENNELKDKHTNRLDKDKQDKETWGRGGQGRWWEDGRGDDDPWKNWTGKAKTSKEGDEIIIDDWKWEKNWEWEKTFETKVRDERATRVWWGGNIESATKW